METSAVVPHPSPSTADPGTTKTVRPKATTKAPAATAAVRRASACKSTDRALVVGSTTAATFSICETSASRAYYRGLTPANGESVEVDNVVRTSNGWLVTARDGTTYAISAANMVITLTTGDQVTSRMVSYQTVGGQQSAAATPARRDANGFALGGPPAPTPPANYNNPSHADCLKYLSELRAWSDYQNQHRPAGSTNDLPGSGDVQYLWSACHLNY
ncbi:hypothetical protein [Flexivirga lutea]